MLKNSVFLFVISHLVPEIFKICVLCKLRTDDVIRLTIWKSKHKIENISASNDMMQNNWNLASTLYTRKCAT